MRERQHYTPVMRDRLTGTGVNVTCSVPAQRRVIDGLPVRYAGAITCFVKHEYTSQHVLSSNSRRAPQEIAHVPEGTFSFCALVWLLLHFAVPFSLRRWLGIDAALWHQNCLKFTCTM